MKTFQLKAKILAQVKIKDNYWHCEFSAPQIAKKALPGQFINIRVSDKCEPLLRRPISIHRINGGRVNIFYEVVGIATEILAQKKTGESLDIIGPLGNGFKYEGVKEQIIVAGGMGVAPLIFLAEKLAKRKVQSTKAGKTKVLIGAKTKSQILCEKEFKKLDCDVKIATDDGSQGFKGRVTDLLKNLLPITNYQLPITVYACGPRPMLKEVSCISKKHNIPAQISLEEHMACGIGACFGCSVNTTEGFKRVCKEGPVFGADEIVWGNTH